ncbi:MAG: hypothetical protein P9X24_14360 [Candidatus Hatepunaea meridiana]|nr:hypothetical protein [Candidatus Hatepunaea meridiana]
MKRCSKCILTETYPRIVFDAKGVCNYCNNYKIKDIKVEENLLRTIDKYRNHNSKYDCAVGISGGRDSAYVAYYAKKTLKLNILAFTVDNGLMTEGAKKNVKNTVQILGIDHVTIKYNYLLRSFRTSLSTWIRSPSPAMLGLLCTGCNSCILKGIARIVEKYRIPFCLHGEGEPENCDDESTFQELLLRFPGVRLKRVSLLLGFSKEVLKNPLYILNPMYLFAIMNEYYYRYLFNINRKKNYIGLFDYIQWDEKEIMTKIKNELGWKKPDLINYSWRSDCKIHQLRQYLYMETLGITKNDGALSNMIREKLMKREDAIKLIKKYNDMSRPFLSDFLNEFGFSLDELDKVLQKKGVVV